MSGIPVLLSLLLLPSNFMTAERDPLFNHSYPVHMFTCTLGIEYSANVQVPKVFQSEKKAPLF